MSSKQHYFNLPALVSSSISCLFVSVFFSIFVSGCGSAHTVQTAPDLGVSKVVLYQNGIGYFERRGEIDGDMLQLRVRPDQVNDVLKSLAVLDFSGGHTSSVGLPVERSTARLARELPRHVRGASGIVGMLKVLRGVQVSVDDGDGWLKGRVVGVEKGSKGGRLTLMTGGNGLKVVSVKDVEQVRIHDKALAVGLSRSLDISKREGRWKPVALTVRLEKNTKHELLISYIHEVPIWRPAYRAWVDDKGKIRLQGWAIVDNVSGEDWNNVSLSLVVGSPLSFRYNLHRTHWVKRPSLSHRMPANAAAPPPADVGYEANDEAEGKANVAIRARVRRKSKKSSAFGGGRVTTSRGHRGRHRSKPRSLRRSRGPRSAPAAEASAMDYSPARREAAMERSAAALVKGRQVGALYRYDALAKVTVPDGKAALINIVNRKVDGEDVFLFRQPRGNPYRAVMIRNGNASALESGPITLYIDGTFAGEGFLGRINKGATTFVPYAQESGFKVNLRNTARTTEARLVKIAAGKIHIEARRTRTTVIKVSSERDKPSLAYVKVRLKRGMELKNPPKEMVKSGHNVFVAVRVPKKGQGTATLVEESPIKSSSAHLSGLTVTALQLFLKDEKAEDALKGPVRALLELHGKQAESNRQRNTLYQQRNLLNREAMRIRRNLNALPLAKVANKLRKQLLVQLKTNSTKAAVVAKTLVENEVQRAADKERLITLLRSVSLK
jgi:hypothetical protein